MCLQNLKAFTFRLFKKAKVSLFFTVIHVCWTLLWAYVYSKHIVHVELDEDDKMWKRKEISFGQAIWWMNTVATTVGYGKHAPTTEWGMIFFILTCVPTIVFGMFFVIALGQVIRFLFDFFSAKFNNGLSVLIEVWNHTVCNTACETVEAKSYEEARASLSTEVNYGKMCGILAQIQEEKANFVKRSNKCGNFDGWENKEELINAINEIKNAYGDKDNSVNQKEIAALENESTPNTFRIVSNLVKFSMYCLFFGFLPGLWIKLAGYGELEGASYLKSLYFHMVSSTTVGFGDFKMNPDGTSDTTGYSLNLLFLYSGLAVLTAHLDHLEAFARYMINKFVEEEDDFLSRIIVTRVSP